MDPSIENSNTTEILADFTANLHYNQIPKHVRELMKNILLDALACAIAGHLGEETQQVASFASGIAQSKESSIIGGDYLSLAGATLLNGYLVTAVTMCDIHRPTTTHIMPEVLPPALAIAERDCIPGRDLLVALTVGCETATRIGIGLDYPAFRNRGFHGPGVIGPFGAAASVGRLLEFNPEKMAAAFGLAGSQSAGTFAAWGTPTVKFHQCRGALSGLMAALLAQQGFLGTRQILTATDGGLFYSYSNGGRPEEVIKNLGSRWELEEIALRLWPSASTIQGLITAMFDMVEKEGIGPEQTKKVRVFLSKVAFDMHGGFSIYQGKFEALLSTHYVTAVILHDKILTLSQFEPERYNDPTLKKFATDQVEVICDPSLEGSQAVVVTKLLDGKTIEVKCDNPRGAPQNPLTRSEIEEKFRTYALPLLSNSNVNEIINIISNIENLESTNRLMDLLRKV